MRPGLVFADGETVDVAIEHEMLAGRAAFEGPDNIGILRLWVDNAIGEIGRIEKLGIRVMESSIRLSSLADKRRLAREVLALFKK